MQGTRLTALFPVRDTDLAGAASQAARAAFRMVPRMAAVNEYVGQNFGESFSLTVGMHVGTVFVGALGGDGGGPTVLGEASEIAERIAAALRATSFSVAASEDIVAALGDEIHTGAVVDIIDSGGAGMSVLALRGFAKPDVTFLVQTSFESLHGVADEFARKFYARLFELAPETKPLFSHVDMGVQRRMLMDVLATAVRGLDDVASLVPTLHALGRRHVGYGVSPRHYRAVGEALLDTLETHFGEALTPEMHLAWREIYGVVARTMLEGARTASAA